MRRNRYARYSGHSGRSRLPAVLCAVLIVAVLSCAVYFTVRGVGKLLQKEAPAPSPTLMLPTPTPAPTPPPAVVTPDPEEVAGPLERDRCRLDISLDMEAHTLTCIQQVEWTNRSEDSLSEVVFRLYPNALTNGENTPMTNRQKAFPQGIQTEGIVLKSILADGLPAAYTVDGKLGTTLRVSLPSPCQSGEGATVTLAYSLALPKGFYPLSYSATGAQCAWFYPMAAVYEEGRWALTDIVESGAPWFQPAADVEAVIRVDSNLAFACSGDVQSVSETGSRRLYTVLSPNTRDFAFAVTTHGRMATAQSSGVTVTCYAAYNEKASYMANRAADMITYYESLLGQCPVSTLEIVQATLANSPSVHGGLIVVDGSLVQGKAANLEYRLAAAVARQWFGQSVGAGYADDQKLHTPMCQYLAALYLQHKEASNAEAAMEDPGAAKMDSLRLSVGSSRFDPALKEYCAQYAGKKGGLEAFAQLFGDSAEEVRRALG